MSRRLKVLMSAYACEPGKGSEPEVGWQWALQMARFHDVMVLTRANNRQAIEKECERLRGHQPLPEFVYHDESPYLLEFKRSAGATKLYYVLWQHSAREVVARLAARHWFDLLHHVTFAAFRYPAAIWGHQIPCVWGPIGGIESIPLQLLPWSHPRALFQEIVRGAHNLIQAAPFQILPERAAATTTVLASTPDMQQVLARHGFQVQVMPTIGLNTADLPYQPRAPHGGPLRLLFVGNIITLKGIDLALQAFRDAGTDATLTLVGEGDFLPAARQFVSRHGLGDRVIFRGRLPRDEVLKLYREFDVFLFPSLHDTGGYALIEAMNSELPVICLDCGGPSLAVGEDCGIKVPIGSRAAVVSGLANAIRSYDEDRPRVQRDGRQAREMILRNYDWNQKGEQMNEIYEQATAAAGKKIDSGAAGSFTGIGGSARVLYRMVSFKGLAVGMLAMLLVGALGFMSLGRLKHVANDLVNDTLPGLSYAGEVNGGLTDAHRTLLFILAEDPARRAILRQQMESQGHRTSDYLEKYKGQIFNEEDRTNFVALLQVRREFLQIRDQVLDLASTGKKQEAMALFDQSLTPMQARVKEAGRQLLEFNMQEGQSRGHSILLICTVTQIGVAAFVIAIFVLGFFIGLSK